MSFLQKFDKAHSAGWKNCACQNTNLSPKWQPLVLCMVGSAYPSVGMLLTAEANHNTCLGEITAGSARVLRGLCFIKTEVSAQAVTHKRTCTSM